jgi:DNA-binding transcriptional LysR family regulator
VELRQLRFFVRLAQELHFGRAAAQEHIAQPAFSQQIRRLEQELGVRLFNRTSRRVELTEPGRVFVGQARSILEAASDAITLVRQAGVGKQGRLRVAYANGADRGVPPKVIDRFRAAHPRVELSLSMQYDEECRVQLRSKEIDAAFFWMPLGDVDDLAWRPVVSEPLVVAVSQRHALATNSSVTPLQVAAEPLVWYARHWSPGSWDTIIGSVYLRHGHTPNVIAEEASQECMVRGVRAAAGLTIVTASTARQLRVDDVVYRPFTEPAPTVDIGLAWRADNTSPLVQSLVRIAGDVADASPANRASIETDLVLDTGRGRHDAI